MGFWGVSNSNPYPRTMDVGLGGGEREFARKHQGQIVDTHVGNDVGVGQTILPLDDSSLKTCEFLALIQIG